MFTLAPRVSRIKPSPTLAVTARAQAMRAEGIDIIGLGAGEPDFDTPEHIKQAAKEALDKGLTKYTAVDGTKELKQAIINKFKRENGLEYNLDEVMVSSGAKQALYNMIEALIDTGDEVIIPAPYWVSYPDMVKLAGGEPVIVQSTIENRFKITADALDKAITPKTKLVILNSPSNPSGTAYSAQELAALGEVLLKHPHVIVATDDIYEHILFEGKFTNILNTTPALQDRTLVINGVSKAYSMTGWRIGYIAGPAAIIKAMKKIQGQSTSNPCSIAQYASVAALEGPQDCLGTMLTAFKARHDMVVAGLNEIEGINAIAGDGTFYIFFDVRSLMEKKGITDDNQLAEQLIQDAHVALVPGSAFGMDGFMRLSFATSEAILQEAIARIKKFAAS